jgi:hypothetical protein
MLTIFMQLLRWKDRLVKAEEEKNFLAKPAMDLACTG